MAGESNEVGSILGYLRLDRSDWDAELNAAGRKADELARHSPNVHISTNASTAIAQLAAVAAATRKLQDAQGAEGVAQARLTDLRERGNASASQLAAAEERVAKARRATAAATIGLSAAHDKNNHVVEKAIVETDALGAASDRTTNKFKVGLIPALLAIAPATLPIAGVATGALLGLIPVAATVIVGVLGINEAFKSGALEGTKYGADINSLADELANIKQVAAGGLLEGIDQGLAKSKGLFQEVNDDVAMMSSQLGDIVAGAGPALLEILTALNPLFVTFGNLVSNGAKRMEDWATNSTGITSFVSYVQAELPIVLDVLGKLAVLFGHLVQAAAPVGDILLHVIDGIATALDAIPVSVLTDLTTAFVLMYPVVKILLAVKAAVKALGLEFPTAAAKAEAAALVQTAAAEQVAAASATEAEGVAQSKVVEADAAVAAARVIAEQSAGIVLVLQGEADEALLAAEQFAAAMRVEAAAAERTAGAVAASSAAATRSAATSAAAVRGQAAVARSSAGAMLGIAAVAAAAYIGGRAISNALEKNNAFAHSMDNLSKSSDAFDQALLKSKGAVDDNVRSTVAAQIQQDGLAAKAAKSGISVDQLTTAVTGGDAAMAGLIKQWKASGKPSGDTLTALGLLSKQFDQNATAQKKFAAQTDAAAAAQKKQQAALDAQHTAAAKLYGLTGKDGVAAYLAATKATADAAAQTKQQTLNMQAASDAVGLLDQALQGLAGNGLNTAQAQTGLAQANLSVASSFKTNHAAIDGNSAAAVANQQAIQGNVTAARTLADALGKQTGSSKDAVASMKNSKKALEDQLKAQGQLTPAVQKYIDKLYDIKNLKVPPTKLDVDKVAAEAKIAALQKKINAIKQGKVPGLSANTLEAREQIQELQNKIDAVRGKSVTVTVNMKGVQGVNGGQDLRVLGPNLGGLIPQRGGVLHRDVGGVVPGSGPDADTVPAVLTPGEWVITRRAVDALTRTYGAGAMKAINNGMLPKLTMPTAGRGVGTSPVAAAPVVHVAAPAVQMPSTLVIVDANGQLIGRMQVEAQNVLGQAVMGANYR